MSSKALHDEEGMSILKFFCCSFDKNQTLCAFSFLFLFDISNRERWLPVRGVHSGDKEHDRCIPAAV